MFLKHLILARKKQGLFDKEIIIGKYLKVWENIIFQVIFKWIIRELWLFTNFIYQIWSISAMLCPHLFMKRMLHIY